MNTWEKTRHIGAHRVGQFAAQPTAVRLEREDPTHG
jgi:hypothetical protein